MTDASRTYAAATAALNAGQWPEAFRLARQLLGQVPNHAGVHFVAGVAALHQHQIPAALQHLQRATLLNPRRADYLAHLARAFATAGMARESVAAADAAAALGPSDALTFDTLGVVYTQANDHEKAAGMFRGAVARAPEHAAFRFNLATALTFCGELHAAEQEYEACLALQTGYWKAHLALSQLRRQTLDSNHLGRLRSLLGDHEADPQARMYLNLALAKELEDVEEFPAAFKHLVKGKEAGRLSRDYTPERDERIFDRLIEAFPEPLQDSEGSANAEPIFVVGMPRSGTTLVDRILSSHPQVHSAGELQNFSVLLKRATGSRTRLLLDADTIGRTAGVDWRRLGDAYVASTRPGTGQAPRFVDKLPHNFLYLGFIARSLPNARIVCLRRNPLDTCLSNFRQLFAQNSPYYDYSFDLLDTGRYYILFDRLMNHWKRVLPGRILELSYESIVDEQQASTSRLLEFCGLPWDDACLGFERNPAPVATASAVQVRSPLYRSSIGRWRYYGDELLDLRQLLDRAGVATA